MSDPQAPSLFDDLAEDRVAGGGASAAHGAAASPPGDTSAAPADAVGQPDHTGVAEQRSFLDGLNGAQLAAVSHSGGHCLVLAGAGSGKTRVLAHRIAWLIAEQGVDSARICAVTFTNKAAAEMRGRVRRLIGARGREVVLSTFHSLGLKLLREWSEAVAVGAGVDLGLLSGGFFPDAPLSGGFSPDASNHAGRSAAGAAGWLPPRGFAVYDRDASLAVWRRCQAVLRISPRDYDPGRQYGRCSSAVSRLEDPASWDAENSGWERKLAGRVWKQYRAAMREAGAVDFDDLLVLPLQLLSGNAALQQRTASRFDHLLVDEYQDTNRLQYRLIRALLAEGAELLVVGDEDQSIYRWRGADLNNVLDFQQDFPGAAVVRLEQNYRSTQPILSAAGSLVANNRQRLGKDLWTERADGALPLFVQCATDREEAEWVARNVEGFAAEADGPPLSEMAVLYRTNAQSRLFEEIFIRRRLPHQVVGGQRFFARREVRDVLAYLQLLVRDDDLALERAVSNPSRGVGPRTLEALRAVRPDDGAAAALRQLASQPDPYAAFADAGFSPAPAERLAAFGALVDQLRGIAASVSVAELIRVTVERSGYARWLEREENSEDRLTNIAELVNAADEAAAETGGGPTVAGGTAGGEAAGERAQAPGGAGDGGVAVPEGADAAGGAAAPSSIGVPLADGGADGLNALRTFLDRLSLLADADTDRAGAEGVRLMSVHAAKGLEFSVVFLTGMEEELFPHASALADGDVEEERRLCYVGMTRARHRLLLSGARSRRINGRERWQEPSRFIGEIDPRHIEVRDYLSPQAVGSRDYRPSSFSGLGGRTGQRQRARRTPPGRPGARRRKPAAAPVAYSGPTRPASEEDLEEGATVVHPMFGPGRINGVTGRGDKLKLDISFRKVGSKTVVAKYAKLEVPLEVGGR